MKRALIITLTFLAVMAGNNVTAQFKIDNKESRISITTESDKVLDISPQENNNFAISIAGFEFTFGSNDKADKQVAQNNDDKRWEKFEETMEELNEELEEMAEELDWTAEELAAAMQKRSHEIYGTVNGRKKRSRKPSFDSGLGYEIGLSILDNVGYDLYPASTDFMALNQTKSIHMSFPLVISGTWLNQTGTIGMTTGVLLTCDNYTFAQNIGLINTPDGMVSSFTPEISYKKSKLTTAVLRAPLLLTLRIGSMKLTGGVYGEWLINTHTKLKFPKEKEKLSGLNQLRYGFYANVGFNSGLYLYGEMGRTELFKTGKGPSAMPCSVGVGFCW